LLARLKFGAQPGGLGAGQPAGVALLVHMSPGHWPDGHQSGWGEPLGPLYAGPDPVARVMRVCWAPWGNEVVPMLPGLALD
jgi:hypothetical protein